MTSKTVHAMTALDWASLLLLSLLWGGSYFAMKIAVHEIPPFTMVFSRVALAGLALALVMRAKGFSFQPILKNWRGFTVMGFLSIALPFSLIFYSQKQIGPGLGAILNATTPIFTLLVAHWLTRDEKLSRNKVAGVLLGFLGVIVLIGPGALAGLGLSVAAQLACICASISYAFGTTYTRRFKTISPIVLSTGQLLFATIMILPVALAIDHSWTLPLPSLSAICAMLSIALLSTALALLLFYRLLVRAGATNAVLATLLVPVSASLLGWIFLDDRLNLNDIAGMLIIGLSLITIDGRLWKRRAGKISGGIYENTVAK